MDKKCHKVLEDGTVMMAGLPDWLFYTGIALILIVSFFFMEWLYRNPKEDKGYFTYDILQLPLVKTLIKLPYFRFLFQLPVFILFCLIIYAGMAGHGIINIAPLLTWTIWWAGLVLIVLFLGKIWCYVCPWDFITTAIQHLKPFGVCKRPFALGLKWPVWLENIYPAIWLFVVLTFIELCFNVTSSPQATAAFGVVMVLLSYIPAILYERRPYCKYGCLVGRISGLYAMFSPIELRSANKKVCAGCKSKDCYNGNDKGNPCPTFLTVPKIHENTYCLLCTECIKSCPHDNVSVNIRPFGTDFRHFKEVKKDEAILAVSLLALTSFHGLTMTGIWDTTRNWSVIEYLKTSLDIGHVAAFAIAMTVINMSIIGMYYLFCALARVVTRDGGVHTKEIFLTYAYSILPIALFYHLAHNAMHLLMEGQSLVALLSDPLGRGSNYFGTAAWKLSPLASDKVTWIIQVCLVLMGHIFGIVIAYHISRRLYKDVKDAKRSLMPLLVAMILSSFLSLWIMHLDMNMRSSLM